MTNQRTVDDEAPVRPKKQVRRAEPAPGSALPEKTTKPPPKKRVAKNPVSKPPKKRTKKHIEEETKQRRRELAAFGKIWGEGNSTVSDGKSVQPPISAVEPSTRNQTSSKDNDDTDTTTAPNADANMTTAPNADTNGISREANADTGMTTTANADANGLPSKANADTDLTATPNADTSGASTAHTTGTSSDINSFADGESGYVEHDEDTIVSKDGSDDEAYEPDDEDGEEEDGETQNDSDGEEKAGEESQQTIDDTRLLLQEAAGSSPLQFDGVDILDPTIVGENGQTELQSDGEGGEDSAEIDFEEETDSDTSGSETSRTESFQRELHRVAKLMEAAELERVI
ncbi:hypothetical protein PHYPSEUDO_013560 [Phytophthora pseudosyringae]|uniref:Uncharacterized protein n=1 Tax=Phytophthora pseudosyringae TaxID=221518 RepID=A0A8T1W851_9STRA|nr:hypothetical protein PHYPSEUDO_013560 [Phytophthora pseudosyringae]